MLLSIVGVVSHQILSKQHLYQSEQSRYCLLPSQSWSPSLPPNVELQLVLACQVLPRLPHLDLPKIVVKQLGSLRPTTGHRILTCNGNRSGKLLHRVATDLFYTLCCRTKILSFGQLHNELIVDLGHNPKARPE